jgi:hypothetical protein
MADKTATLTITGSTYPNWSNTEQKFTILTLTANDLKWRVAAAIGGATETSWQRIK